MKLVRCPCGVRNMTAKSFKIRVTIAWENLLWIDKIAVQVKCTELVRARECLVDLVPLRDLVGGHFSFHGFRRVGMAGWVLGCVVG